MSNLIKNLRPLLDLESSTLTYLLIDRGTASAILIDPVLENALRDLKLINELGLTLRYTIETHIHADHITALDALRQETGCLGIVPQNAGVRLADKEFKDNEILQLGQDICLKAINTPGHTDSHMAYVLNEKAVFTGDALFIRGCGRTDFQGADPGTLYDSVTQRLFTLPSDTIVFPAHDYKGMTLSTIAEEKLHNPRFVGKDRAAFIELMNSLNLPYPKKIDIAVPANMNAGRVVC
jgi:sulfur dioxygenase